MKYILGVQCSVENEVEVCACLYIILHVLLTQLNFEFNSKKLNFIIYDYMKLHDEI